MPLFKPFDPFAPANLLLIPRGTMARSELQDVTVDVVVDDDLMLLHGLEPGSDPACGRGMVLGRRVRGRLGTLVDNEFEHQWCPECWISVRCEIEEHETQTSETLLLLADVMEGKLHNPVELGFTLDASLDNALIALDATPGLEVFETDVEAYRARDHAFTALLAPVAEELVALAASFEPSKGSALPEGWIRVGDSELIATSDQLGEFSLSDELTELMRTLRGRPDLVVVDGDVPTEQLEHAAVGFASMRAVRGPSVLTGRNNARLAVRGISGSMAARALSTLTVTDGKAVVVEHGLELANNTRVHALPADPATRTRVLETFTILAEDTDARSAIESALALEA